MAIAEEVVVQLRTDMDKARADIQRFGRSFSGTMKGVEQSAGRAEGAIAAFGRGLVASVSVTAIAAIGKHVLFAADQYRTLQGRIKEATRETGDFEQVSKGLFDISQRTGTALEANVTLYQRLASVAANYGASSQDILNVVENFQKLGVIGGASMDDLNRAAFQLAQALGEPIVRMEDFASIIDSTPEVVDQIGIAMGKTRSQVVGLVRNGKLFSQTVIDALKSADGVNERFDAMPTSIERAAQTIETAFTKAAGESSEFAKSVKTLTGLMTWIANNMDSIFGPLNERLATTRKEFEGMATAVRATQEWLARMGIGDGPSWQVQDSREWKGSVGFQKPDGPAGGGGSGTGEESAAAKKARLELDKMNEVIQDAMDEHRVALDEWVSETGEGFAEDIADDVRDMRDAWNDASKAQADFNDGLIEQRQAFLESIDPIIKMNAELVDFARISASLSPEQRAEGIARIRTEALLTAETLEGAGARGLKTFVDGLDQINFLGGDIFGGIANAAKQAVNQMIAEFIRLQAIKPLLSGLGSVIGGGFGGFLTNFASTIGGARANGGPVSAGKAYLVGERGPEIVVPKGAGMVISNDAVKMGGRGPTNIYQTINVDGRNSVTPQNFARQIIAVANQQAAAMDKNVVKATRQALPGQIDRINKLGTS